MRDQSRAEFPDNRLLNPRRFSLGSEHPRQLLDGGADKYLPPDAFALRRRNSDEAEEGSLA